MFTDKFLDSLPDDPKLAVASLCREFFAVEQGLAPAEVEDSYGYYAEAYAALEAYVEAKDLPIELPQLDQDTNVHPGQIRAIVREVSEGIAETIKRDSLSEARSRFRQKFGLVFVYEFSDGDLKRVQTLLNEMRDVVSESEDFDAGHKERILKKLERLQSELHKKVTSLDRFYGLLGEGGVALGKFGKDAKPFVDRVKEVAQIIWRTQARAEELPSDTTLPLLTLKAEDE